MTKSINVLNPEFFKKKKEPLKLNLQYFAEPEPEPDPEPEPNPEPDKLELTQEELDKKIEAEADRKLTKSLEKKKVEWEQEKKNIEADAKKTAEEYAKLTAKEKEDTEYKKRMEALDQRERELNDKQLLSQIETDLKDNDLSPSWSKALLSVQNIEEIKTMIVEQKKENDKTLEKMVNERLKGDPPKVGNTGGEITKEQFNKMGYSEREKLFTEKPDSYNKLIK